jgi:predicted PurR-regulated permease PerM
MTITEPPDTSPKWSSSTKLVVGLTFIAIVFALLYNFRTIIGPLLLAFILAYLLNPLIARLSRATRLNWRMSVNVVYLFMIIILGSFSALAGFAIMNQIQSLIEVVQNFIADLPNLAADLSTRVYTLGPLPFHFSLSQFDLTAISNELLSTIQPMVGRVGTLVSSFAASAAVTIGWGLFVLIISYFLLADTHNVSDQLVSLDIPGYSDDLRRLSAELKDTWNAFLRGQLIIIILVILLYTILMSILGLKYALGIAILAGVARFIPYIGPLVTLVVASLVALLQGGNYYGLPAWQYAILVVVVAVLTDQIMDNLVSPRIFGSTLGVHPAAVLIAAIIAANLIGLIGLVLAAPVVATLKLFGRYLIRKMFDLEPFPPSEHKIQVIEFPWARLQQRLQAWFHFLQRRP